MKEYLMPKMVSLFSWLLIFNIFAGGFVLFVVPFEFSVSYISVSLFLIYHIYRYRSICINRNFLIVLMVLASFSLINIYFGKNTFFFMTKQLLGISLTALAYYSLIKINNYDIDKLFKIYLRLALIVASIGIFQEFSRLINFKIGYDYSFFIPKWYLEQTTWGPLIRINSICLEPSHFGIVMSPASFVALFSILGNKSFYYGKVASAVILLSMILTFSGVAYIALLLSLLLFLRIGIKKLRYLPILLIPLFVYSAYYFIPEIRLRLNDTVAVITGKHKPIDINLSTYALATNSFVAYKAFRESPLFGHGLGSHPVSYDKFLYSLDKTDGFWKNMVDSPNRMDAGSLFLRLISETGFLGIAVIFYFIFRFYVKRGNKSNIKIMNDAVFILLILQLLRQGHYFYNGLFFFVWLYYFSYKIHKGSAAQSNL